MGATKHTVVIVGGSVGGLRAATLLARDAHYDVTLISKKRTFDHRTSLYRNRKGRSRHHISLPLQHIFRGRRSDLDLVRAEITSVDPARKVVRSDEGIEYAYDSLIVALEGESRHLDGIDPKSTFNAYSASHMNRLRRQLIYDFENNAVDQNYTVVGAGETGVEIAYELRRLLTKLAKTYETTTNSPTITLVEGSSRILPLASPDVSRRAMKKLKKMNVDVRLKELAHNHDSEALTMKSGKTIPSRIVITAAGTRANHFFFDNEAEFLLDDDHFVRVNVLQEAEGYNNIYVIGNSKSSELRYNTSGKIYDANYIVKLLHCKLHSKDIPPYEPPEYEVHMQLGHGWAIYETTHRTHAGTLGWVRKRWLDRTHFSTLLPTRLWLRVWLFGTQHDEIQ